MSEGNSLAVQWLGLGTFTAGGPGSIPDWCSKIPQAMSQGQKKKKCLKTYVPSSVTVSTLVSGKRTGGL